MKRTLRENAVVLQVTYIDVLRQAAVPGTVSAGRSHDNSSKERKGEA